MALFLAAALATYGYVSVMREPVDASVAPQRLAAAPAAPQTAEPVRASVTAQPMPSTETPSTPDSASQTDATAAPPEDRVGKWIAETSSDDAKTRADAIVALGDAPRARALPALVEVVDTADSVDVPLAMGSLKRLAMNQGDADERIRSVVRKAIYHGSDDTLASVAQATLSDIEGDLSHAKSHAAR